MPSRPLDHKRRGEATEKLMIFLRSRIVGQDRALRYIASAFSRMDSKLRNKQKPIGSFLMLGPSGVGKSETARVLAKYLFGHRDYLTLIDCTAFSQPHEVAKLKGAPPGYVGFKESGKDPESPYPYLSHYNVYKYDHWRLRDAHKQEIKEIEDLGEKLADMERFIDRIADELGENRTELGEIIKSKTFLISNLDRLRNESRGNKKEETAIIELKKSVAKLEKEQKERFAKSTELREKIENIKKELFEAGEEFNGKLARAFEEGWLYSPDQPSERLKAVALFDEIEKADRDLPRHIMEILDTGRFECDNGDVVSFKNTFVFATSNVGQRQISDLLNSSSIGFQKRQTISEQEMDKKIYEIAMEELKKEFDQEFLNRFDKIVVFHPLGKEAIAKILEIRIADLMEELETAGFPIRLKLATEVKNFLVAKAMKRTEEGARLLSKRLDSYIRDGLAALEATGQIKGKDCVLIKLGENDEIVFEKGTKKRRRK